MKDNHLLDDLGFVIICPERNWGGLRASAASVRQACPGADLVSVVPDSATDAEVAEFSTAARTLRGRGTISGLMNVGLGAVRGRWRLVFVAGNTVREPVLRKYDRLLGSDKEVVFPVIDRRWTFDAASINGLLLPGRAVEEVGPFSETEEDLATVKLLWAATAIEKGYGFRALVGVRV